MSRQKPLFVHETNLIENRIRPNISSFDKTFCISPENKCLMVRFLKVLSVLSRIISWDYVQGTKSGSNYQVRVRFIAFVLLNEGFSCCIVSVSSAYIVLKISFHPFYMVLRSIQYGFVTRFFGKWLELVSWLSDK